MSDRPKRLLVVCPSWLGDVVMATPALRLLRRQLPGAFIGGLLRPGLDELLAGTNFFDEVHVDRAQGVMGPKLVASRLRPRRYDAAVLLTNSFSTALITRLAFIPRRIGYDRDGRGLLLTDRLKADRRVGGGWACVPAVEYYLRAARAVVGDGAGPAPRLELAVPPEQAEAGARLLAAAGVAPGETYAVLNPGANNPAKRWPSDRFAQIAAGLVRERGMKVLVNGSPAEADLAEEVARRATEELGDREGRDVVALPGLGGTIGSLKAILGGAVLMVTNDTGPRHIAAAFGTPTVTLYGPTDPRWTTLPPGVGPLADVVADATLPEGELADDHPERCRIDRIGVPEVAGAIARVLAGARSRVAVGPGGVMGDGQVGGAGV